jgi:hypothetical protein
MNDLVWDKRMLGVFEALACLSDEEETVLKDWAAGKSIVHTSLFCHMSERKVNDIRKRLRVKYDRIQPYADLPKRNIRP